MSKSIELIVCVKYVDKKCYIYVKLSKLWRCSLKVDLNLI